MSIYANVTEQDLIILWKFAEQQKNESALRNKIRISKKNLDIKLAETLSHITKKLEVVNESTKNLGGSIKESNSEDNNKRALSNSSNFSESMREILGSLMNSRNSSKIAQNEFGQANILVVPIQYQELIQQK